MTIRKASHCGSWYTDNKNNLDNQLSEWLKEASVDHSPAKAIIVPHAGYSYSGPTAAFAYKQIDPTNIERVFILGPSHHVSYGDNCVLSPCDEYATPFYNLPIDKKVYRELESTNNFGQAKKSHDEEEHSLEMQLPYIAKTMESRKGHFSIVPIIVGNLTPARERIYGQILAPYFMDPTNLFVISSDFCHWGKRFRYTYYDESFGEIWKSIENLDKLGMEAVTSLQPERFMEYMGQYHNTICGRHPIGVLLNIVAASTKGAVPRFELRFVKYAQSEHCQSIQASSVSYAAASLVKIG